jgi:hypothetical protein
MSNKAKPVDRAMPTIRKPKGSDGAIVSVTRSATTAMQGSSLWASNSELQAANTAWNKAADALESNAKIVRDLRTQLTVAETSQRELRHAWDAATKHMTGVAAVVSQGSADNMHALGFDVLTRVGTGPGPLAAPTGLTAAQGSNAGQVILTWECGIARHGSLVQHATDIANPATYSTVVPSTRTKYTLGGFTAQSIVHFPVAFIDPAVSEGMSPWSNWVAGTAS